MGSISTRLRHLNYRRVLEPYGRQQAAKRVTPGLVIRFKYRGRSLGAPVGAGRDDEMAVRRGGAAPNDHLYVATRCIQLGYVGLEVFLLSNLTQYADCTYLEVGQAESSIFLSTSEAIEDVLTRRWEEYAMGTILRRLVNHYDKLNS